MAGYTVYNAIRDIFISEDLFMYISFLAPLPPTQFSNSITATAPSPALPVFKY